MFSNEMATCQNISQQLVSPRHQGLPPITPCLLFFYSNAGFQKDNGSDPSGGQSGLQTCFGNLFVTSLCEALHTGFIELHIQ